MSQDEQRTAASAGKLRIIFEDDAAIKQAIESVHGGNVQALQREVSEINGSNNCVTVEFDIRTKAFTWVRSSPES